MEELTIYCDGGSRGNPGPSASAFVVYNQKEEMVYKKGMYLGITTNNVAEYQAILLAMEWLDNSQQNENINSVTFFLDTELATKQLNGEYKIRSPHLAPLASAIKQFQIKMNFPVLFKHVKRVKNAVADTLVNETLDLHRSAK